MNINCPKLVNNNRAKIIKNPIDDKDKYVFASFSGRSRAKTLEPSRGGIGSRLKIAKRRLSFTIRIKIGERISNS